MKQSKKILLLSAVCAVLLGMILSLCAYFSGAHLSVSIDSDGLYIGDREATEHHLENLDLGQVRSIEINAPYTDVQFREGDRFGFSATYYTVLRSDRVMGYRLEDGVLKLFYENPAGPTFQIMNLSFLATPSDQLTVYLPAGASLEDVTLRLNGGTCSLGGFQARLLDLSQSYGSLILQDCSAATAKLQVQNGSVSMRQVTGTDFTCDTKYADVVLKNEAGRPFETLKLTTYNGSLVLENPEAAEGTLQCRYGELIVTGGSFDRLEAETYNGSFNSQGLHAGELHYNGKYGSLIAEELTARALDAGYYNGKAILSGSISGPVKLHGNYGSAKIETDVTRYGYQLTAKYGSIRVNDVTVEGESATRSAGAETQFDIQVENGDIILKTN